MKVGVPKERLPHESRVAISPDTIKKLRDLGFSVIVESGAGDGACFCDNVFKSAGAEIAKDPAETFGGANIVLKVRQPVIENGIDEVSLLKPGTILISTLGALSNKPLN